MKRAAFLLMLALLLAGCAKDEADPLPVTTPTPEQGPPPPPPPPSEGSVVVAVNDTWRYRGGTEEAPETLVVRVTRVANGSVHTSAVTTYADNGSKFVNSTLVASTLALSKMFDSALGAELGFTPPLPILIPAEDHVHVGNLSVPTQFGVFAQPVTANVRFLGMENVTVPAGTFVAYRYNATVDSQGFMPFHQESELWFAPEVKQSVKTITDGRLQELVSYELG